ncbi:MAG TPA: histidine kinase [Gaiellaceae bacterium]|nr:histidine kinase [Gaiellaceae bacterium]
MTLYRIAGAIFGAAFASTLVLTNDHPATVPLPWLIVYLGSAFCAVGVVAQLRRPENATGSLLYLVGITTFAVLLTEANRPALFTLGVALGSLVFAALVHLLLAYPTGMIAGRSRSVVIAGWALAGLGPLVSMLFADEPSSCRECPSNLLAVTDRPGVAHALDGVTEIIAAVLVIAAGVLLVQRWRRASSAYRRSLRGVYAAGAVAVALLVVSFALAPVSRGASLAVLTGAMLALAVLPFAFLLGVLRARFAGAAAGRLVARLGPNPAPGQVRQVLRDVLHDPSLEVAYRLPEASGYVDIEGKPFEPEHGQALTYVEGAAGPSGVLAHDPALLEDPQLLDGVTAAVRLAVENEQLHAELRARLLELERLAQEQAALRRVATAVAAGPSEPELARVVTREVGALFDSRAEIVRAEPESQQGDSATARALRRGEPQHAGFAIAAPIAVGGRLWGAIEATRADEGEPFDAGAEQHLAHMAALFAQALANAEARSELRASRARIVEAGDAERRKLERNLHDGAQQRLVAVSISLRLAGSAVEKAPDDARERLVAAADELSAAIAELRELARGIHPAILTERGLGPAVVALAERSPIPVEVRNELAEPLPAPVEAAAYYVVSESLANVVKHAQASTAEVRVRQQGVVALVEVLDDGVGGASSSAGSGLRGLSDRVEALDGRLGVESEAGRGTRVWAEFPCL